ncbi:MAG: exo-alpha-sialidase, partial [Acidimicrobiales bacterium]
MTRTLEEAPLRTRATDHLAVAVGTTKGLFLVSDGVADGPHFPGAEVPAFVQLDDRYLAAVVDPRVGSTIAWSDDGGMSWQVRDSPSIAFPQESGDSVVRVWQLHRAATTSRNKRPVVFAGVEPAALFGSIDGGESFELVRSLWTQPDRESWSPGGGGLCLHTVLTHEDRPDRILVGISTGGVYRSEDGGRTFDASNEGIEARLLGEPSPGHGQCVHKMALDASGPDVAWLQNHWGVYRSDDGGRRWENVGRKGEDAGLPSDFGFPVVAHPVDHDTCFVYPLESDEYRCAAGARSRVYRTTDGGKHWEPLGRGLPQQGAHHCVLR